MPPKVSVIIPVYNIEAYLRECLESVCNQTLDSIQIIVVDDGSTDGSAAICREFADRFPEKVEYYYKENGGSASARNMGLDHAVGDYVGFIDSDDWVEPDMYEKMCWAAATQDADMVFCRVFEDECPGAYEYVMPKPGYYSAEALKKEIFPFIMPHITSKGTFRSIRWSNCLKIYRKNIIDQFHIRSCEGVSNCEDLGFNTEFMLHMSSLYYLDEQLYHNRPNPMSQSRNYVKNMWPRTKKLILDMHRFIDIYADTPAKQAFDYCVFYFMTMIARNEMQVKDRAVRNMNIQAMLDDPLCREKILLVNSQGMNQEYSGLYTAIASGDARHVVRHLSKVNFKKRKIAPIISAAVSLLLFRELYKFIRHR